MSYKHQLTILTALSAALSPVIMLSVPQFDTKLSVIAPQDDAALDRTDLFDIDVIELPPGQFPEPKCNYSVHLSNRYGPTLSRQVYIGEPLYHRWECSYGSQKTNMYCMVIQNCTVSDARASSPKVQIIDGAGCSLFPKLIPNIVYHTDLEAGMSVSAFSLDIDSLAVEFNCSIRLKLKQNNTCQRPICDSIYHYLHN